MIDFSYDRLRAKINLDAIKANFENIKARLPLNTKIIVVLKADGYGHGARVIGNFLAENSDYYMVAVAGVREAMELRREMPEYCGYYGMGLKKPILVLGYTDPSMYETAIENDVSLTVFDSESARIISEVAESRGMCCNIHVAVDTGMRRIGFLPTDDNAEKIRIISKLPGVRITGIFTHFARADETDQYTTDVQFKRFNDFVTKLESMGVDVGMKHISNSALIMQDREKFDCVRAGIIMYGYYPSDEVDKTALKLIPAMTLSARVVNISELAPGEGISYGHTFVADRPIRVATISAGYADGISRQLSNRGYLLIHKRRCRILGRICMDQMMVDISDVEDVRIGDEAVIFGMQETAELSVEEVSALANSFNYEMICAAGKRVPRIYYENGQPVEKVDYI